MEKINIAICYDFDKTLSCTNMQEYTFLNEIKTSSEDFWNSCEQFEKEQSCDQILAYMLKMLEETKKVGIKPTKEFFFNCAKDIEFFEGVETWFSRINQFAQKFNINVEHYIISSGLKEIIEGTSISKFFKQIYACSYCYNKNGEAFWPATAVNYTNKTQYLYRVNKGIYDVTDLSVNDYTPKSKRVVPFENIIYIGDSQTDIPSMKLIKSKSGYAIGVYRTMSEYYSNLINLDRVNYIAKADYQENSELDTIIKELVETIYHKSKLNMLNQKQKNQQTQN